MTTSIREIYLKLYIYYLLRIRHKQYKFRCELSIIKGTLPEEQRIFSSVSRLLLERSTSNYTHTHYFLRMRHKQYKFSCDRFIIKGTLLEEQRTFSSVSRPVLERSTSNYTHITYCACATSSINFVVIGL